MPLDFKEEQTSGYERDEKNNVKESTAIQRYSGGRDCLLSRSRGAHLLYALFTGVFRQVNFMGLGVQVDVFR